LADSAAAVCDRRSKERRFPNRRADLEIALPWFSALLQLKMNIESFREYCLKKRGATEGAPFGEDVLVFKVSGKMFALAALDEVPSTANLKCDPDLALELRDRYEEVKPGYHMNKKHWNTVELDTGIPDAELRKMIDHSYELVVNNLPRAKRARVARHR
jgi:predicted DNA-binding protein (MmcQ/YjbR family)